MPPEMVGHLLMRRQEPGFVVLPPGWQQHSPRPVLQLPLFMHTGMTPLLDVALLAVVLLLDELVVKPPVPPLALLVLLDDEPPGMHVPAWHVPMEQPAPSGLGT